VSQSPKDLIRLALDVASSGSSNDLPIAAVVIDASGSIIASSRNAVIGMGEATAHVIGQALKDLPVRVTRLSRGVPVGSELEYVDVGTIAHSFIDRR